MRKESRSCPTVTSRRFPLAGLLIAGAVGCGAAESDPDEAWLETIASPDDAGQSDGAVAPLDGGLDGGSAWNPPDASADAAIAHPEVAYFASVTAYGTGCPAGTTNTSISPDGKTLRLEYAAFEVDIAKQTPEPQISKNCELTIQMHSPKGLSFGVKSFAYHGYAFLEEGVQASQWARYYFQGNPVPPSNSNRVVLTGPYDSDFVFRDVFGTAGTVWSPCGTDRVLNVDTRLQVKNSLPKRTGYVSLSHLAVVELAWRSCNGAPQPPPLIPSVVGSGSTRGTEPGRLSRRSSAASIGGEKSL
jgi:hypothetical protein